MTYTFVHNFFSTQTFFLFFLQTTPLIFSINYTMYRRFPLIFSKKKLIYQAIVNLIFNFICSYFFYYFEFEASIIINYIQILCFSFFQFFLSLKWNRINNNKVYFYFMINLLAHCILMSFMTYIRLAIYSYLPNQFLLYYLLELIPLSFCIATYFIFNLLDTFIQSSVLLKRLTILTIISFFFTISFNLFSQFISIFGFSNQVRITIFDSFLFKDTLIHFFPNAKIIILNQSHFVYRWGIFLSVFGLFLLLSNIIYLFIAKKKQDYAETVRREKELIEYISVIENIVKNVQKQQHDYSNILLTFKQHINTEPNISAEFKNYFQQVFIDFELNTNPITIPKLENIKTKEIHSLILGKYQYAKYKNIDINIDVSSEIVLNYFNTLSYCKILGILIDNAFNASLLCEKPSVSISLITEEGKMVFIIENNTVSKNVLADIRVSSTKIIKNSHGYGISIIQSIINDHNNIILESSQNKNLFMQTITIFKE